MGNIKDVIDIDGTKRQLDIDSIVKIELRPVGAALSFRAQRDLPDPIIVNRHQLRLLSSWLEPAQP